ncbi:hypothetical protein CFD26_100973 [Aspergillus turcosus]|uniref:Zn(2)-C6 fungal-type domain-containing protein n=1 Tax=Aspergillus turcosus TaxID=1245748 RepID=A0A3R7F0F9_9EURO|nr:hypothetical protein CFD26_100973 [Aspergillus turcosus]
MDHFQSPLAPDTWPNARDQDSRPRKRRRKYITKACNECKRRKIKCNGQSPCQRCGRQQIECVYAERTRPDLTDQQNITRLIDQMSAMQEQISALSAAVYALSRPGASPQEQARAFRPSSSVRELTFQGPTTSAFSLDLAKSSLQRRGIVDGDGDGDGDEAGEEGDTPPPAPEGTPLGMLKDPLWTISKAEAIRLCRVYEEEMGIMYPVLELEELLRQVEGLYGLWPRSGQADGPRDYDVYILRLVFACALTAEASGRSELAMRLFESVRDVADDCVWGAPDIDRIIFLTLVAIFYFQMDEEALAWRTIGIVERMCLEKGLHRRETLSHPTVVAAGRDRVLRLFWSVYTLDMRWSFGTGMPFSLEDSDIDPWLPEPEEKTPYLRVMIRYSRIAAKVWKFISAFNNTGEIKKDEMNYLDWQVSQWAAALPASLRLGDSPATEPRSIRRLRSLLYLRANQLRMLIHRPVLHSAAHIVRYPAECQTAVDLAKDTIRFITRLNETSDIYQLQQVAFNWFLVSALAVLFLAVAQSPSQFSSGCKEEFYMALELVKGFSTQSYISRRLWKSIKSLRKLGPQVGLQHQQSAPDERVLTAINQVDMAATSTHSQTPQDGAQMTQELMEWFEAVGTLENQIMGVQVFEDGNGRMANGYMYDYGGDLSSVMRDLF